MAFAWTAPKGQGLYILKEVLTEMRDNTDYLDDNPAPCLTNNTVRYDVEYVDDKVGEWSAVCVGHVTVDYGSQWFPRCSGQSGQPP